MKLGILLPIGSSFKDLKKSGQDQRFINYYFKKYSEGFEKVYIFSYENEKVKLPKNCVLIPNKHKFNRFFYSFLLPFLNLRIVKDIDVFRVMQLTGAVPAILTKIFFKIPFIFTYGYDYSSFAKLENQNIRAIFLRTIEKIAVKFSFGIIFTNKKIKSYLRRKYPDIKLFYIPNGVDISKFKLKRSTMKQFNNETMNILSVARLEKQKNLDNLIKATALLNKKQKIKLLFIGSGKLKLQLIKLAKKLNVDLKIIDKVLHNKITKYYQKADIFCLPSFAEGQPKVLLEAMSCGLPCLAGKYAGSEEFVNKKEILLTGFEAEEIADNLEKLIKNVNLRKKLSQNARKKIEKDFNIEKLLEKEIGMLKNLSPPGWRFFTPRRCVFPFVWLLKKSRNLSALSCRLTQLTGKSRYPIHPKHLIDMEEPWYLKDIKRNDLVLDLGCGNGQHSLKISKKVKKIIAVDDNEIQLKIARDSAVDKSIKNIKFSKLNLEEKLIFKKNSFDKILALDILEHLNKRKQFLSEIKRILKPKGMVFITAPNKNTSWKRLQKKAGLNFYTDPDHKIEYSLKQIKSIISQSGFKILTLQPIVYDTPLTGFVDLIGSFSLKLYKNLSLWKKKKTENNLKESIGFRIKMRKNSDG